MTFEELIELYEAQVFVIKHNDNGDWDYDPSVLNVRFEISDSFAGSSTKKLEDSTINLLQDLFDQPGWELKNGTAGIKSGYATLLVEHHQHKRIENEMVPSGILITKSGYWWYGIDNIGFFVLKAEFLKWVYEHNQKIKRYKDAPIESQKGGNQGYAFLIPYDELPYLFWKYKQELLTK